MSAEYSHLTHLECTKCGTRHDADIVQGLCACGGPLRSHYDLDAVRRSVTTEDIAERPADLWRYHELLPVRSRDNVISLGEGMTPLVSLSRLGALLGLKTLLMKDEGLIPTGTFKARGAAVGISRAKELGVTGIAMPTNGNAGAAWATYAAKADMDAFIVMPQDAPHITRVECTLAGAELYLVDGLIGDAAGIVQRSILGSELRDVSTLKEPYRLEGKKTMGYEIAEQLGWRMPDVIVYPAGGGVGLVGIYKALRELLELGWVSGTLPRLVAVQADGCAPIVRAWELGAAESQPWPDAHTIAFGITVAKALGDFLVLEAVYETQGCAVAVSDDEILADLSTLAHVEGRFICPEGAATIAAVRKLVDSGWLSSDDEVVVLNTGSGLKYPGVVATSPLLLHATDTVARA
jgi:threonine synthase